MPTTSEKKRRNKFLKDHFVVERNFSIYWEEKVFELSISEEISKFFGSGLFYYQLTFKQLGHRNTQKKQLQKM